MLGKRVELFVFLGLRVYAESVANVVVLDPYHVCSMPPLAIVPQERGEVPQDTVGTAEEGLRGDEKADGEVAVRPIRCTRRGPDHSRKQRLCRLPRDFSKTRLP